MGCFYGASPLHLAPIAMVIPKSGLGSSHFPAGGVSPHSNVSLQGFSSYFPPRMKILNPPSWKENSTQRFGSTQQDVAPLKENPKQSGTAPQKPHELLMLWMEDDGGKAPKSLRGDVEVAMAP